MPPKLNETQISQLLSESPQWQRDGDTIRRTFTLSSFTAALAFVSTVGHFAEAVDHHPDMLVQWKKVTLILSTHSAGGLTEIDFAFAKIVDALPIKGG
jgi:4a-hydroxytetrahydrobiopterin dehydratase